ncbi:MAG TPA: serine/threonine-protein kinase PknK, partial [Bryobacteraceae bacterium]|nr:serine/threonine-protein kinase PknK [Bryobacteraceae bacterium]
MRKDEEFILYRRQTDSGVPTILLVEPVSEHPAPATIRKLEHAYSLRAELSAEWAVRPVALTEHNGRTMLVLEDPGGEPLDNLLGEPMELSGFLRLGVSLSSALGKLHAQDLIHKDIKPANVLVDCPTGRVWLMGFGIATQLPRERQSPEPPEFISGTLPYMAPEQTGRMNRSIDSRSDLYALGVTLYEMLTGSLPFTASDPMEWVHCHIARQPAAPAERLQDVPASVSAIIMKLLAKTAEERYQTSAGVENDLRRCLAEWEAQRRIETFPPGEHDTPDHLQIPEILYGRAREIETLLASFDRIMKGGDPELVLVCGYSGLGKSSLVSELHKALVPSHGLFASGKFDQNKRDIPYATLAQAFQSLIHQLLSKSEAELREWREALYEALGPNGLLMTDLVPELKLIIGEQPPVPELPPQDAQRRFHLVFRRFMAVFARPEHPLALFLDDLQWLDAATLDVVEDLLVQGNMQHLLLIGAYRDNEVDSAHSLIRRIHAIRNAGVMVQEIILAPLRLEDLGQLIADSLRYEPESTTELAQLVHDKTAGNPFFAIQFLSALGEEGLLAFDHEKGRWSWDLNRIRAKGYTENVADLMVGRLHRLPYRTQIALQELACLGHVASMATLSLVRRTSEEEVHNDLWEALRQGLIEPLESSYQFVHDRVQEAAYSLILDESRAAMHLRIGRLLAAHIPEEKREEAIFEIVNQLNRGTALITAEEEREQLAEFNLMAGKRAKTSTAYASAVHYLRAGAALLADDRWERRHDLAFPLELHRAECEFLTGELATAEERLAALSHRATNTLERAVVACLRMTLYTTLDRSHRGVEVGLEYLGPVGVSWSPHPTKDEVRDEYKRLLEQLGSRPIETIVDLPRMKDPELCATLDVLTTLQPSALFTDRNLSMLVVGRMANLSLEYGNHDASCHAYVWVGMIVATEFGDYQAGFRFGRVGVDLAAKHGLDRFKARAYLGFAGWPGLWGSHARSSLDLIRRAYSAAQESGDPSYVAYACDCTVMMLLITGDPLAEVQREAENGLALARKAKFGLVIDILTGQLRLILTLRGLTPVFGSFNDTDFDETSFEQHLDSDPRLALAKCWYWNQKLQARFYAGDYESAMAAVSQVEALLWTFTFIAELAAYHFCSALVRTAMHDSASPDEKAGLLEAVRGHYRELEIWAENCPENFENRRALVGAEIARLEGRELEAERLYEQAIESAHENGFVHNEALANELAGRFYAARGFKKIADTYLRDARRGYFRWGADGKVRQLDRLYPGLNPQEPVPGPGATIGAPVEHLDLATVMKVSQAVSGEIVLEKLIDTLMRTAVEHAGAERGLLIVQQGPDLCIEAEATTSGDRVTIRLDKRRVSEAEVAMSVLHFVARTQESVILDDAF